MSAHHITARDVQLLRRGLAIGNQAVVAIIEEGMPVRMPDGLRWFDTRPLLDPHERSNESIDRAAEALSYGEATGLIRRHSAERYLVCVVDHSPQT